MTTQNHAEDRRVALSTLATTDSVLRDSAIFGLLVDSPTTVAIHHDILVEAGAMRRVVADASGVLEDVTLPLTHACLSCAMRSDVMDRLHDLAEDGRWDSVLLGLPVGAVALPVTHALATQMRPGGHLERLRLAASVTVVDLDTVEHDLLGRDSMAERGLPLAENDDRLMSDVVAEQLEQADLVMTSGQGPDATASALVERMRAVDSQRVDGLFERSAVELARMSHDARATQRRAQPDAGGRRRVAPVEGDRAWTLELSSPRPFHPERLLDEIDRLGTSRARTRGIFWVANRPDSVCAWDGAGRQLHIGEVGLWEHERAHTRITLVGANEPGEPDPRPELRAAFARALTTPEEIADGGSAWLGRSDVLEPWLGSRSQIG